TSKKATPKKSAKTKNAANSEVIKEARADISKILKAAPKQKFYTSVEPMLATLVDQPFDSDEWIYEVKWDGYRAVAFINEGEVEMKSRNDKSFNEKFYPIYDEF